MPSVKEMYVMHALALTVPSARMIFKRKGDYDTYNALEITVTDKK